MKIVSLIILGAVFFMMPLFSFAQEIEDIDGSYPEARVTSNLNIYDALILEQSENIVVSFTLQNDFSRAQGDVNYDVRLYDLDDAGSAQSLFYRQDFDDVLSMAPGESVKKQISFQPPKNANGTYEMWIFAYTTAGDELGFANLGQIQMNGVMSSVVVQKDTCAVLIEGSQDKYLPLQGIDFDPETESINLECEMKNNTASPKEVSATFSTNEYSMYGKSVSVEGKNITLSFNSNEAKKVAIPVPFPKKAGSYNAKMTLADENGSVLDIVNLQYVVQGESASINEISTDKEFYNIGEEMNLSILWSSSADGFAGSRKNDEILEGIGEEEQVLSDGTEVEDPVMHISVTNTKGEKCIEDISEELDGNSFQLDYSKKVIKKCQVLNVRAEIKNKEGKTLAEYEVLFDERSEGGKNIQKDEHESDKLPWKMILMIIIGGAPIAVLVFFLVRKKNLFTSMFILFITFGGLFISFDHVRAVGLSMDYKCVEMPYRRADPNSKKQIEIAEKFGCVYHFRYNRWMHRYDNGGNVPTVPKPAECFRDLCQDESKVLTVFDRKYRPLRTNVAAVADAGKATVVLDKREYSKGENMIASANGSYFVKCGNGAPVIIAGRVNSRPWREIVNQRFRGDGSGYDWYPLTPKSRVFTAPESCGPHTFNVFFRLTHGGNMTRFAKIPFNVVCIDGNISVGTATCADRASNTQGVVNVTLNNFAVTGTNARLAAPQYEFKCGARAWTAPQTSNTYECRFDAPGTYTVQARATTGPHTKTFIQRNVIVSQCNANGTCGDRDINVGGPYTWQDTGWGRTSFCRPDDTRLNGSSPRFPSSYDMDVEWTCNGIGTGTPAQCSNRINQPPPCECGSKNNIFSSSRPSNPNLCSPGNASAVTGSNGQWAWTCTENSVCTPESDICRANCVDVDIDVLTQVYLEEDDSNDVDARIKIAGVDNASNIDCTLDGKDVTFPSGSDTSDPVTVTVTRPRLVDAECTMSVACGGSGSTPVTFKPSKQINTLCMERSCNAQGACQGTPKGGITSASACSSTCTSDADCSGGRMIETRP